MRSYENLIFGTFMLILGAIVVYSFLSSINTNQQPITDIVKSYVTQVEVIEYSISNNTLYLYIKPTTKINLSSINVIINKDRPIIKEIGDGNGIIDPNRGELIEVVYKNVLNLTEKNLYILIYGKPIMPRTILINVL